MEQINYKAILIKKLGEKILNFNIILEKQHSLEQDIDLLKKNIIELLKSDNYDEMLEFGNWEMLKSLIPLFLKIPEENKEEKMNALYNSISKSAKYKRKTNKQKFIEPKKRYIEKIVKELEKVADELEVELKLISKEISETPNNEYIEIKRKLEENMPLSSRDYEAIEKILEKLAISETDKILFLEAIRKHNITSKFKNKDELNYDKLNAITNALTFGFEMLEDIPWLDIDTERRKQLDNIIEIISTQDCSKKDMEDLLPRYEKDSSSFSDNYSLSSVKYIYISVLKKFQDTLIEYYNKIKKLELYKIKTERDANIAIYNDALQRYLFIRNLMNKTINEYNIALEERIKQIEKNEEDVNIVHFGTKESGTTFLESDLKSISPDNYTRKKQL